MTAFPTSDRAGSLAASQIRIVAEEGMSRDDVIPLYFGEGAWPTDPTAVTAAVAALKSNDHFYLPNNGRPSLRAAIADYLSDLHANPVTADSVSVTASGTQALALTAQVLVDPGDQVICLEPAWPNIAGAFKIAGAQVQFYGLHVSEGKWVLDTGRLLQSITPKTKALVINSPSNPTGWALSASEVEAILEKCRETGTWLVCDEVYSRLYRHERKAPSPLDYARDTDRVVSINSFSKAWSMTGWRLGWIVAPPSLLGTIGKITEFNTACAPGFVQAAAEHMIRNGEDVVENLNALLAESFQVVQSRLMSNPRTNFVEPDGAFYAFFSVSGVSDSLAFAQNLLRATGVGLAPGVAFGEEGEGMFRLCYAQPKALICEALDRIETYVAKENELEGSAVS